MQRATLRRPGGSANAEPVKKFNAGLRVVQGFRNAIAASSTTTITINLNSSARKLLGIACYPVTGLLTTFADTQISLTINNFNVLLNVGANNLNPDFVGNMIFFPCPQILKGNDTISMSVLKNDAGATTLITNFFYVPVL